MRHDSQSPGTPAKVTRTLEYFKSSGQEIRVETFAGNTTAPSIIVLHGATGVEFANRFIAVLAHGLAIQGFSVHLVHYFDRTGAHYADDATIKSSSTQWLSTIQDAVEFVRSRCPLAAIGLFGYSLGGYLAAAVAVRNEQIKSAVILFGGLDEASADRASHAPPALILHGETDSRVPLSEARRLESVLQNRGNSAEVHIYPGEGHVMSGEAYMDVMQRSVAFLRAHLDGAARQEQ